MKNLLAILLIAACMSGTYGGWGCPAAAAEHAPTRVTVHAEGRVVPNLDLEVICKASGEVIKLPVDVGDSVEKGKLVLEVDSADEQRLLKQADIRLASSQAKLAVARQGLLIAQRTLTTDRERADSALRSAQSRAQDARKKADRLRTLFEKKLASQEDADTAETTAIQATADLEAAQIRLKEVEIEELGLRVKEQEVAQAAAQVEGDQIARSVAQQHMEDTAVVAPIAGVVTERQAAIGQIIAQPAGSAAVGTPVLRIADLSRLFVVASVGERDIGKVAIGQHALIAADAFPGRSFPGMVRRIAPQGANVAGAVTFEVKIELLDQRKPLLRPRMTASAEILVAETP